MREMIRHEVLLVEDDPEHVELMAEGFRQRCESVRCSVVSSAAEAMAYLRREGRYVGAARPDLILMDLHLPGKNGHELLREIKSDPFLKQIVVVIMTSSLEDSDVLMTYGSGGNCYVNKPRSYEQFVRTMNAIEEFWFNIVRLPPRCLQ